MAARKSVCDHATPPMPPLRPGIGKQQMEYFNRSRRQQLLNGVGTFHPQNAGVGQPVATDFPASPPHSSGEPFDSKEVARWVCPSTGHEKRTVAASEIDLQRGALAHKSPGYPAAQNNLPE